MRCAVVEERAPLYSGHGNGGVGGLGAARRCTGQVGSWGVRVRRWRGRLPQAADGRGRVHLLGRAAGPQGRHQDARFDCPMVWRGAAERGRAPDVGGLPALSNSPPPPPLLPFWTADRGRPRLADQQAAGRVDGRAGGASVFASLSNVI